MNPQVLAALRGAGKSHDLVSWLCAGEPTGHWLGWSRMVIVQTEQLARFQRNHHRDRLAALVGPKIRQDSLIIGLNLYQQQRGIGEVEIAIDGADEMITRILRRAPAVIALHGEAIRPGELDGHPRPPYPPDTPTERMLKEIFTRG